MIAYLTALTLLSVCLWGSLVLFHGATQSSMVQARCDAVQRAARLERMLAAIEE